ncbi:P-loop containing nucleoside triphosphate hydrolase protein [Aspergillus venezuelensis]
MHHSWLAGQKYYGRHSANLIGVVPDKQADSIKFSQRWHAYLSLLPDQFSLDQRQQLYLENDPAGSLPKLDTGILDQILQDFMQDDSAMFYSSSQREAFYLILLRHLYCFIILPTASGKTTLFLIGASLATRKITIIISPLIALKMDLFKKAKILGLDPILWDTACDHVTSRILLVQIEHVSHPRFLGLISKLHEQDQIERIIWDECHMIPLTKHYRMIMNQADQLLKWPIPMAEQELKQILKLNYYSGIIPRIQGDLVLPNMAYHVQTMPDNLKWQDYHEYLGQFYSWFQKQYLGQFQGPRPVIIIFCMTKVLIQQLSESLRVKVGWQVARFHADLQDHEKVAELSKFQGGEANILLASSAIGAGFDFNHVDAIIHLEETGRAGRNPRRCSWSFCLVKSNEMTPRLGDTPDRLQFRKYLNEQICRRRPISMYFDNTIKSCSSTWQSCDLCILDYPPLACQGLPQQKINP